MNAIETKEIDGFTVHIGYDEHPMNPRTDFDNAGTIVCFHRKYNLGDDTDYKINDYDSWENLERAIEKDHPELIIMPVYMYDHGNITISTSPFSCSFDSGQIGFIFISKENIEKEFEGDRERAENCLISEVNIYDKYISGQVVEYVIMENDEIIDSCGSFYEEPDSEYILKEINDSIEYHKKAKEATWNKALKLSQALMGKADQYHEKIVNMLTEHLQENPDTITELFSEIEAE